MKEIISELPDYTDPSEEIEEILRDCRKIAVVGLSPKESRDSNRVARYLMEQGYEIVPVNPGQREILGRTCYRSLKDIPFQVMENLNAVLGSAGADFSMVVKATVYLADINHFAEFNGVYGEYFASDPPARSAFQVAALPLGAIVEIEMVAFVG